MNAALVSVTAPGETAESAVEQLRDLLARRKVKVRANVRAFYTRAEYVTPRVALDKPQAAALRAYMKRAGLGVSDAIRAAILAAAPSNAPSGRKPPRTVRSGTKAVKSRPAARS